MSEYQAPVRDMRFQMRHVVDLATIAGLAGYEHAEQDLVDQILEQAGRFATEVLSPLNGVGDQNGATLDNGVVRTAPGFAETFRGR